jgi:hypothetical protein
MPEYRIYFLNKDGHIAGPADCIACPNDRTATEILKQRCHYGDVELWNGSRFVERRASAKQESKHE